MIRRPGRGGDDQRPPKKRYAPPPPIKRKPPLKPGQKIPGSNLVILDNSNARPDRAVLSWQGYRYWVAQDVQAQPRPNMAFERNLDIP